MPKKAYILILLLLVCFVKTTNGQNIRRFQDMSRQLSLEENYEFGNKLFAQEKYYAAIDFYNEVLEEDDQHTGATYHLGIAYAELRDYEKSGNHLKKLIDGRIRDYPLLSFHYGLSSKANGNLEEAKTALQDFIDQNDTYNQDEVKIAQRELESCLAIQEATKNAGDIRINILDPSNKNNMAEFGATKTAEDAVIYTSIHKVSHTRKLSIEETKAQYDDFFVNRLFVAKLDHSGISGSQILKIKLASDYESIGSPSISEDGNKLYYTICKSEGQDCNIYFSQKKSRNKWSDPVKLNENVNAPGSKNLHPVLGKDNSGKEYIFFSSDRRGGQGGFDLWYAKLDEEGNPSAAINLGASINTKGKEVTPYFDSRSNLLFFSSDGHQGLGQLDVYMVTIDFMARKGEIYNLGYPINSRVDDYYFSLTDNGRNGFLSSNRVGNVAANQHTITDNLYRLAFNEPFTYKKLPDYISRAGSFNENDIAFRLFTEVFDYKDLAISDEEASKLSEGDVGIDGSILEGNEVKGNEMVYLMDEDQNIIDSTRTDENGRFSFRNLPGDKKYSVFIDGNEDMTINMSFLDDNGQELLSVNSNDDEEYFRYKKLDDRSSILQKLEGDNIAIAGDLLKEGQPAASEWVYLVDQNGQVVDSAYTDEQGKFHFKNLADAGNYTLRMSDKDMQANMSFLDEEGQELLTVNSSENEEYFLYRKLDDRSSILQKIAGDNIAIAGDLLKDGQPAANEPVYLVDQNGQVVDSAYTDDQGKFHFRNLADAGNYTLRMNDDDMQANMSFLDDNGKELVSINSSENEEFFRYKKLDDRSTILQKLDGDNIAIAGDLLQDGQPAANELVYLVDQNGQVVDSAYTDEKGKFHFRNLADAGNYTLRMNDDDMQANMSFLDDDGKELISVNSGKNEEFFRYKKLGDRSTILQKLDGDNIAIAGDLFKDGQPAANELVYLVDQDGQVVDSAYTDEKGEFHFRNLADAGNYTVRMNDDDMKANISFMDQDGKELLTVNSANDKEFFQYKELGDRSSILRKFEGENIAISGDLFKHDQPATNEKVYLVDQNGQVVDSTYTDEQGEFHFRNLTDAGNYTIRMSDDDMQANMSFLDDNGQELLSVNSNENTAHFDYQKLDDQSSRLQKFEEDHIVISVNLLKDGKPAAKEKVLLVDENGKVVASGYTDEQGNFDFRNLAGSGNYTLRMDNDDNLEANMDFFDRDENLLLSTTSEDNSAYFDYRDLSDVMIASNKLAKEDTGFRKPEKSQAEQLRELFSGTMSYNEYNDLIQQHGEKIKKDINLRVQIGAFRRPRKGWYRKLGLGKIDVISSRGYTKFLVGNFEELEEAEVLRKLAFDKGVNDAFISVYYKGTRVALLIYNDKNQLVRKFKENNDK